MNYVGLILIVMFLLFGEEIIGLVIEACPPILLFIFAIAMIGSDGCLAKIGGVLLIPVGIVALIAWLVWLLH